ncbi:MAG TPA: PDZ domain-containing protein [Pseudogracilibacillus sp.]|nr:PDZ domain-containing protein [Pseudogracilibacillus sp.]
MADFMNIVLLNGVLLLLNPLFYIVLAIVLLTGYRRIKNERRLFRIKLKDWSYEWKQSLFMTLIFTIVISAFTIYFQLVMTKYLLIMMMVLFISLFFMKSFSFLSAVYTIGLSYTLTFIAVTMMGELEQVNLLIEESFTVFIFIMALLIVEVVSVLFSNRNHLFSKKIKSNRGLTVGASQLKRGLLLPFVAYVPTEMIEPLIQWLPFIELPNHSYQLVIIPFLFGYQFTFVSYPFKELRQDLIRSYAILLMTLSAVAMLSMFLQIEYIGIILIVLTIFGRELIVFLLRLKDRKGKSLYYPVKDGLKIIAVIEESTASEIGLKAGETILKVNGYSIRSEGQFYQYLREEVPFYKLYVQDMKGKERYLTCPRYEAEHHELGLLFASQ